MRRNVFDRLVNTANFKQLFIAQMGWNQVYGQTIYPDISVGDQTYSMVAIAERSGLQILVCEVNTMPTLTMCKKIDIKLRRLAFDYICIYVVKGSKHHQWVAPIKKNGKREIISIEYNEADQANFLFSKIDGLTFAIDQISTIADVKEKVQKTFALNSEKITKNFYAGFKKVMGDFTKQITGGWSTSDQSKDSGKWKQWYASIMLNRLMFCYFIQKKGFLNGDKDYLRHKLDWVIAERGANRFYGTFYKNFLTHLFHNGLNAPVHNKEFEQVYGRIPFLNGGLFGFHLIEQEFPDIDIEDQAFKNLFDFLDTWNWHLDTRLESDQKDVNPDVLGYIFEQYVNDKADMGAYYTQEDITEYISKNCILPYILGKLLGNAAYGLKDGYASRVLQADPTRYIYDSVKYGYTPNWKNELPDYIREGLNFESDLLETRKRWGEKSADKFGLEKESWRDTIERYKRCDNIINHIVNGNMADIKGFITENVDIRLFAVDLIQKSSDPSFIETYYKIVLDTSILDIACGSGAFLFASMNILEPIYEELLAAMLKMKVKDEGLFIKEQGALNQFARNPQFYIYSCIALNNLYGVDIMREAVETAKLRLFLRMASALEVNPRAHNMGLDPLPDIDFNLFSGNSLTGISSLDEVSSCTAELATYDSLRKTFVSLQLYDHNNMEAISSAKKEMNILLRSANLKINHQENETFDLETLISNDKPFHWPVQFCSIMQKGGFDVIVGNPPYRENRKLEYDVSNFATSGCGNVYTCMLERALDISRTDSFVGMIVQLPIVCTDRMRPAQQILENKEAWLFNFDDRPGKLFENLEHIRATILILTGENGSVFSSSYNRWYTETRNVLFNNLTCVSAFIVPNYDSIPKVGSDIVKNILQKLYANHSAGSIGTGNHTMYYHNAPLYFTRGTNFLPFFSNARGDSVSSSVKPISFSTEEERDVYCCLLNSSLFYMWYVLFSDCRHLNVREIENFPLGFSRMNKTNKDELVALCSDLMKDLNLHKIRKVTNGARNGLVEYDEFKPKPSKPIFDKIDKIFGKHFNFTKEELDYIINYDIKFRMGDDV